VPHFILGTGAKGALGLGRKMGRGGPRDVFEQGFFSPQNKWPALF